MYDVKFLVGPKKIDATFDNNELKVFVTIDGLQTLFPVTVQYIATEFINNPVTVSVAFEAGEIRLPMETIPCSSRPINVEAVIKNKDGGLEDKLIVYGN